MQAMAAHVDERPRRGKLQTTTPAFDSLVKDAEPQDRGENDEPLHRPIVGRQRPIEQARALLWPV
jgi:hypothetical protein